MNCKKVTEAISDHIDNCLSADAQREMDEHLRVCPQCAENMAETQRMLGSLRSLSGNRSPVECWAHVRMRLPARTGRESFLRRYLMRPAMAAPAFGAALALAFWMVWPAAPTNPNAKSMVSAPEYKHYIGAHSRLQRTQALTDPDVVFVVAELEQASMSRGSFRQ